ncbi:hypothetical protein A3749_11625, partial [Oleiphilus sp. HI0078]
MTVYDNHQLKNTVMSLTNIQVKNAKPKEKAYKLSDGGSMYLLVNPNGSKYWRYDYRFHGARKTLAVGVYPKVSLAEAREELAKHKKQLELGNDPQQQKKIAKSRATKSSLQTFEVVCRKWHKNNLERWSPDHAKRVLKQLEQRALPFIGNFPIADITAQDVLAVLRKLEDEGLGESTRKLKQRMEAVFVHAIAEGLISYNPVAGLEKALAAKPKQQNNPYLAESEIGEFLHKLGEYNANQITKIAVNLVVRTFVRTKEIRFAMWREFDLEKRLWTIPDKRMKMGVKHLVPLTDQMIEFLEELRPITGKSLYLFPSRLSWRKPFSENTMLYAVYRLGYKGQTTIHGFRAAASTILNENGFNKDAIERQLAHGEKDKIRGTYNHAEYLDERKDFMQWYSDKLDQLLLDYKEG